MWSFNSIAKHNLRYERKRSDESNGTSDDKTTNLNTYSFYPSPVWPFIHLAFITSVTFDIWGWNFTPTLMKIVFIKSQNTALLCYIILKILLICYTILFSFFGDTWNIMWWYTSLIFQLLFTIMHNSMWLISSPTFLICFVLAVFVVDNNDPIPIHKYLISTHNFVASECTPKIFHIWLPPVSAPGNLYGLWHK